MITEAFIIGANTKYHPVESGFTYNFTCILSPSWLFWKVSENFKLGFQYNPSFGYDIG